MDRRLVDALVAARDAIDHALGVLAEVARANGPCQHIDTVDVTTMGQPRTWMCRACGALIAAEEQEVER